MKSLFLSTTYVLMPSILLWWFLNSSLPQHVNSLNSEEVRQLQHYDQSVQTEIAAIWKRIENALREHHCEKEVSLNPPATPEQIKQLEKTLGYRLPADYKASLLVHNGCRGEFCSYHNLYSTERILQNWKFQIGESGWWAQYGIHPVPENVASYDWHPGWVPVAGWDVYNIIVNVETGQVCSRNESNAKHDANSWKVWLETVASRLESGELQLERSESGRSSSWTDLISLRQDRKRNDGKRSCT